MRSSLVLAMLGLVGAGMLGARAQETWPTPAERLRIETTPAFREYLRIMGIDADPPRDWVGRRDLPVPDPLSGKRGDFWTLEERKRLFGR